MALGAYVPPNEDTVCVAGGLGTQADASTLNGGGATKAVWDANSPSDFIGTNGGAISTAACSFTAAGHTFSATNIGLNVVAGTLAQVIGGDSSKVRAGIYEVTAVTDDDNIVLGDVVHDDDEADDTNVTVVVGGAITGSGGSSNALQEVLDLSLNDATAHNRYIYYNYASSALSSTVDVDTNSGNGADFKIIIIGYNITLTAEAEIIISTNVELANGLVLIAGAITDYVWKNIDFDGGGKDSTKAAYCINNTVNTAQFHTFIKCKFHQASADGIQYAGFSLHLLGCGAYLNGAYGVDTTGRSNHLLYRSAFNDNDQHGAHISSSNCTIIGNLFYDNGKDSSVGSGLYMRPSGDKSFIFNNTSHGNYEDGFYVIANCDLLMFINNTSVGNGGYGYNIAADGVGFFGWNHSSVNTTAHTNKVADGSFADYGLGNNKADTTAAASIFTNVTDGSEDFTPQTGTDLIDNALKPISGIA
jgi:hypothetical protein